MAEQTPTPEISLSTQKVLLLKRDARIHERFRELYKKKRLRLDDVMVELEEEFFITQRTIRGILKKTI